jgi:hypothetical protein
LVKGPDAICVVPGNHDIVSGLVLSDPGYYEKKFASFNDLIRQTGVTSCLFPRGDGHSLSFESPLRGPIYVNEARRVIVLAINSSIRCGELDATLNEMLRSKIPTPSFVSGGGIPVELEDFKSHLIRDVAHVTQLQIQRLETLINAKKHELAGTWNEYLRIAVLHHHLAPYPGQQLEHRGYEFMVDPSRVLSLLEEFDFDVALTGHRHETFEMKYPMGERKDIFLIGGTTIGGSPVGGSGRGFRLITFESDRYQRKVTIKDIQHKFVYGNAAERIEDSTPRVLAIKRPTEAILSAEINSAGFGCGDVVASTRITRDGDALRAVECHKFRVKRKRPALYRREIALPSTSGYVERVKAGIIHAQHNQDVIVIRQPDEHFRDQPLELQFDPPLGDRRDVSYQYEWVAVNAFAQDGLQFQFKYPSRTDPDKKDAEFVAFNPVDPARRLTLIV